MEGWQDGRCLGPGATVRAESLRRAACFALYHNVTEYRTVWSYWGFMVCYFSSTKPSLTQPPFQKSFALREILEETGMQNTTEIPSHCGTGSTCCHQDHRSSTCRTGNLLDTTVIRDGTGLSASSWSCAAWGMWKGSKEGSFKTLFLWAENNQSQFLERVKTRGPVFYNDLEKIVSECQR